MPARIQATHPWYPRLRLPYQRQAAQPGGGGAARGGGRGAVVPGGIDTGSTGNVGGDLVKAISNTIQQNRQNAAANQILNTQTPPRAGAVGPVVDPTTGQVTGGITPTTGTPQQTGGMGELQLRQQQNQQDLADELQRAKIASELALAQQRTGRDGGGGGGGGGGTSGGGGGGNASRWKDYLSGGQGAQNVPGGTKGKQAAYEPGSIDPLTDPNADKFPVVQADFDSQYGKGMYGKVMSQLPNIQPDNKGNYAIPDAKGDTLMTMPGQDASYWLARANAARVRGGQQPVMSSTFPSVNPNSGQPGGTEVNPYKPANQLEARSLPYKSFFVDPATGQVGQKLPEEKQTAPTGQKTSQTSDQGQGLADVTAPTDIPQQPAIQAQPPPQLAALTPGNAPAAFDLGQQQSPAGGLPDTDLANAIAQARTANQLRVTA